MSDVHFVAGSKSSNLTVSACGARLRIESRRGKKEIGLVEGGQPFEIKLSNADKVICLYGTCRIGLIFTKQRNGVSLNMSATPDQGERKEITISDFLLSELIRESLSNSPKAPKVDYSGVDLSRMSAMSGR